jgi:hypothetical protein
MLRPCKWATPLLACKAYRCASVQESCLREPIHKCHNDERMSSNTMYNKLQLLPLPWTTK